MTWYDDASHAYRKRLAFTVHHTATASKDVNITIPAYLDYLLENLQDSSTYTDIRVAGSDGTTAQAYDIQSGFSIAAGGVIELQSVSLVADTVKVLWFYFDAPTYSDGQTTFSPSSPLTGYAYDLRPGAADPLIVVTPPVPGRSKPRAVIGKHSGETIFVWWDVSALLAPAAHESHGHRAGEEVSAITQTYVLASASDVTAMYDMAEVRVSYTADGRTLIRTHITGGTSGTDYTHELHFTTSEGRTHVASALLKVLDPAE